MAAVWTFKKAGSGLCLSLDVVASIAPMRVSSGMPGISPEPTLIIVISGLLGSAIEASGSFRGIQGRLSAVAGLVQRPTVALGCGCRLEINNGYNGLIKFWRATTDEDDHHNHAIAL